MNNFTLPEQLDLKKCEIDLLKKTCRELCQDKQMLSSLIEEQDKLIQELSVRVMAMRSKLHFWEWTVRGN